MTLPLQPPYAVTASYMKRQYDQNYDINNPYGASNSADSSYDNNVFNALVTPPASAVTAEAAARQIAYDVGFSDYSEQSQVEKLTVSGTGGKFRLAFGGEATTALAWNASAATIQAALSALTTVPAGTVVATAAADDLTFSAAADSGTWTLTFGGKTTAAQPYNVTAAALQTALEGLSSVGSGNVTVASTTPGLDYEITWAGDLAGTTDSLTWDSSALQSGGTGLSISDDHTAAVFTPPITVSGTAATSNAAGVYTVTYGQVFADIFLEPSWEPALSVDPGQLTPQGTAYAQVKVTSQGRPAFSNSALQQGANKLPGTNSDYYTGPAKQSDILRNEWDYGSGNNFAYTPEES